MPQIIINFPIVLALLTAEMFFILSKSKEILIAFKRRSQLKQNEIVRRESGLIRNLLIEAIIFIPVSVFLFFIAIFPFIKTALLNIRNDITTWHALFGIISYGFPFSTVKVLMIKLSLKTLQEFANISDETITKEELKV